MYGLCIDNNSYTVDGVEHSKDWCNKATWVLNKNDNGNLTIKNRGTNISLGINPRYPTSKYPTLSSYDIDPKFGFELILIEEKSKNMGLYYIKSLDNTHNIQGSLYLSIVGGMDFTDPSEFLKTGANYSQVKWLPQTEEQLVRTEQNKWLIYTEDENGVLFQPLLKVEKIRCLKNPLNYNILYGNSKINYAGVEEKEMKVVLIMKQS